MALFSCTFRFDYGFRYLPSSQHLAEKKGKQTKRSFLLSISLPLINLLHYITVFDKFRHFFYKNLTIMAHLHYFLQFSLYKSRNILNTSYKYSGSSFPAISFISSITSFTFSLKSVLYRHRFLIRL